MSDLTGPVFSLTQGQLVVATVASSNAKGQGPYSAPNTVGGLAQVAPLTPLTTPRRGAQTTDTQLEVDWDFISGPGSGGPPVTGYEL